MSSLLQKTVWPIAKRFLPSPIKTDVPYAMPVANGCAKKNLSKIILKKIKNFV